MDLQVNHSTHDTVFFVTYGQIEAVDMVHIAYLSFYIRNAARKGCLRKKFGS